MGHVNMTQEQIDCLDERRWWWFLLSSFTTLFAFILMAGIYTLIKKTCGGSKKKEINQEASLGDGSFYNEVKDWAQAMITGVSPTGRALTMFIFMCKIAACVIYFIDTNRHMIEECISWEDMLTLQLDFALGIIFLCHFLLRFLAADNVWSFIFSVDSMIDFFTLPPLFLSIWVDRVWIGLRYFRLLVAITFPDQFVYLGLISSSSTIRLCQLVMTMITISLFGAGTIFLLENTGDPWKNYENRREFEDNDEFLRFAPDCLYFVFVTMSTVGYGDFLPTTDLSKVFTILFIFGSIGVFASYVPEIAELLGNAPKYNGSYKVNPQRQFIVVCGNINYESVSSFLSDFFNPAREDVNVEAVFLNKLEPDLEFEGLIKRESRVHYFQGTMLNPADLQRVVVEKAAAVLVLCNKFTTEPNTEDKSNIMRVISLKNYCEDTRVIIQLMNYHNKAFLLNIPGWDWRRDDQAVCLNEVKFGLLAQSCLGPGFFTMASNLITTNGVEHTNGMKRWKRDYLSTSHKVILAETLSPTFVGFTFQEVAEICYLRLNLMLIAVEARKYEGGEILINPRNKRITANAIGLFVTDGADSAKRAWFYCRVCHENVYDLKDIKKCSCKRLAKARADYYQYSGNKGAHSNGISNYPRKSSSIRDMEDNGLRRRKPSMDAKDVGRPETAKMTFDSTGCFHWCPSKTVEECTLTRQEATVTMFASHIIVAVFADPDSPLLGLRNLVMPLRASNIAYNDLRHIIIVGNVQYIKREWAAICNLPKVSAMDGNPLSRADLRAVKVNLCRMCIILSAKPPDKGEPVLADKEVIMAALNIKSMDFGADFIKDVDKEDEEDVGDIDREVNTNSVPILLDLAFASNVRYLDDHEMYMNDIPLFKTLPFASGIAMARGILDSLMSATYFNASCLRLIRQWVTGGANMDLEKSLAEGAGLRGGYSTPASLTSRSRVRVEEIVLANSPFSQFAQNGATFVDLFSAAIRETGTVCLAIYRLMDDDIDEDGEPDGARIRVVLSCPDNRTLLQPEDHIIALVQWEDDKEKTE